MVGPTPCVAICSDCLHCVAWPALGIIRPPAPWPLHLAGDRATDNENVIHLYSVAGQRNCALADQYGMLASLQTEDTQPNVQGKGGRSDHAR